MKPISLRTVAFAAPLLIAAIMAGGACAPDDPTVTNTAGTSSTAGSTSTMAGSTGGGAGPTAGTTSTAGSVSTAGTASGGAGTAGTPAGGTGSGGVGTAGTATGGTGGAPPAITVEAILSGPSSFNNPGWKDSWWVTGCSSKHAHDCYTMEQCPAAGSRTKETFPVGGVAGKHYKVSFTYNGVNEGRGYQGGTKDKPIAADLHTIDNNDSFHRDGTANDSKYNELRLTVFDDKGVDVRHYFMNSFSQAQEDHYAFLSSYKKSIVIVGGGKIEHMVFDSNCHAIDNCNANTVNGDTCASPRRLPGADGQLMLPPFYQNPNDGLKIVATNLISITAARTQPWKSQASHITVTAIEETTDEVTKNYPDPQ